MSCHVISFPPHYFSRFIWGRALGEFGLVAGFPSFGGLLVAHIYVAKWGESQTTFFGFLEIFGLRVGPLLASPATWSAATVGERAGGGTGSGAVCDDPW